MSHSLTRSSKPKSQQLLLRILDQPDLVSTIQKLEPRALGKLITHIGLEDAGELVALATTEQLKKIFDDDLWQSEQPGRDETFSPERFALWLEVMLEAGEDFTARKLTELPEDLVMLALHHHILVINLDELAVQLADCDPRDSDADQLEKALDSHLYQEFDEYRVLSKRHDGWDAIVAILCALDKTHHDFLQRILERCCSASSEVIEENGGLYHVLTSEEMLESDAGAEREDRRAQEGYVTPSSATAFLRLARATELRDVRSAEANDPITRAYFRMYSPERAATAQPSQTATSSNKTSEPSAEVIKLLQLLQEAEVLEPIRPPLLLQDGAADAEELLLKRALGALFDRNATLHARRMQELSYLANVLISGCSFRGRSFRPLEAAEAAVATCNLGLEHILSSSRAGASSEKVPAQTLETHSADQLFRVGFGLLFRGVLLLAARTIDRLLTSISRSLSDRQQVAALTKLQKALQTAVSAGRPWTVRSKLDLLDSYVGEGIRMTLQGLLDECPAEAVASEDDVAKFIATAQQLRAAEDYLNKCGI